MPLEGRYKVFYEYWLAVWLEEHAGLGILFEPARSAAVARMPLNLVIPAKP